MELLLRRLGDRRDEVSFAMTGAEIAATTEADDGTGATRETRAEVGRQAIFEIVDEVCRGAPELESDWFAVRYQR